MPKPRVCVTNKRWSPGEVPPSEEEKEKNRRGPAGHGERLV